jgi:glycosyltransferase involved in cell wall biosynthesis
MLEAMASGCLLLGSDTAPVQEVLQHSSNGLHVNFFDAKGISSSLLQVLETPQEFSSARSQARADAQKISCMSGLEEYTRLLVD